MLCGMTTSHTVAPFLLSSLPFPFLLSSLLSLFISSLPFPFLLSSLLSLFLSSLLSLFLLLLSLSRSWLHRSPRSLVLLLSCQGLVQDVVGSG